MSTTSAAPRIPAAALYDPQDPDRLLRPPDSSQRAAPGGHRAAADTSRGTAPSLAQVGLPAHVIALLATEGVTSLADWRRLGRKRHRLFGITRATARQLETAMSARKKCADPEREATYLWEFHTLAANAMTLQSARSSFAPDFYHRLWTLGYARFSPVYGEHWPRWPDRMTPLITTTPPMLVSSRIKSHGRAAIALDRNGKLWPVISFGRGGAMKSILIHEVGHHLSPEMEGHGSTFRAIVLALYIEFLGLDRSVALHKAHVMGLAIDGVSLEECALATLCCCGSEQCS